MDFSFYFSADLTHISPLCLTILSFTGLFNFHLSYSSPAQEHSIHSNHTHTHTLTSTTPFPLCSKHQWYVKCFVSLTCVCIYLLIWAWGGGSALHPVQVTALYWERMMNSDKLVDKLTTHSQNWTAFACAFSYPTMQFLWDYWLLEALPLKCIADCQKTRLKLSLLLIEELYILIININYEVNQLWKLQDMLLRKVIPINSWATAVQTVHRHLM